MAKWTFYAHRSSDGEPVAELPLRDVSIEDTLSGTSTIRGILDLYDPMAARNFCAPWLRELTAVRDNVIAMHGPIVARIPDADAGTVEISASSPQVYFYKRSTETPRNFKRDKLSIVRQLVLDATAKTGGDLYRMSVSANNMGYIQRLTIGGTERQRVSELIESLSQDADHPFDFRWDYTWANAAQHTVNRILNLGAPTLGRDLSATRVIQLSSDLVGLTDTEDGMVVANRIHVLGAGSGTKRLRAVANSGSSLNAGYPLLEEIFDHSDIKSQAQLNSLAAHIRNILVPGARRLESTHQIGSGFPYGAVDLGDTVGIKVTVGAESVATTRRVVVARTDPQTDQVTFVYYDPTEVT